MFTPGQLRPLLEAISRSDAVIVGGQAINLWSELYGRDEEPWRSLRPFTSRDLDALASAAALLECARLTGGEARFPEPGQGTVNTGQLSVLLDGRPVDADFLSEVKGLNNQEIRQTARAVLWQGLTLRLLHPILCVESKTINLMRIQQEPEERQDHKHLRLALANAREFLVEQTANPATHPIIVRWAQRLRSLATDQLGLEAARVHAIAKGMLPETGGGLSLRRGERTLFMVRLSLAPPARTAIRPRRAAPSTPDARANAPVAAGSFASPTPHPAAGSARSNPGFIGAGTPTLRSRANP